MTDAGRRLVPDGTQDTQEDVPVIEAHFQDVCRRENRFLLWRKCSYPSALKHSRPSRKHAKGVKSRAGSATELELGPVCSRLRENKGRNSLPGVPKSWLPLGQKPGKSFVGGRESGGENEAVYETEEDRELDEAAEHEPGGARERAGKEKESYGGVKKKLSHFWKGSSDKHGGSVRSKGHHHHHSKTNKSSGSEESVHKSDWHHHNLKSATSDSDFNKSLKSELTHQTGLRKVSSTENTDTAGRHIRYGVGNLPRLDSSRENVKLRHVERDGTIGFERSISADQKVSFQYSKDTREFFDEEAESTWSLDRSSFQDKHRHEHVHSASSSSGAHSSYNISGSSERLPSRHNLTLPGLNIARPSRSSSHHISDISTSNYTTNLQPTRTRRSGKVDHDFFSFQTHLSHWKSAERSCDVSGNESSTDSSLSAVVQKQSSSVVKPPVGRSAGVRPKFCDQASQTLPISGEVMRLIEGELKTSEISAQSPVASPTPTSKNAAAAQRRKSSVDSVRGTVSVTEDCSPSVGDTILRYLRMARKKSVDGDKADRFKTVNYDRTLRYIKSKPVIEDDNVKNIQTNESWLKLTNDPHLFEEESGLNTPATITHQQDDLHLFSSDQESSDLGFASSSRAASSRSSFDAGELTIPVPTYPTSPQSPGAQSPSSGHSFLAQLLHGLQQAAGNPHMSLPTAMQKSKSSSSVGHHAPRLMAKKIWRTRSKSQSRATPSTTSTWTPQVSELFFCYCFYKSKNNCVCGGGGGEINVYTYYIITLLFIPI